MRLPRLSLSKFVDEAGSAVTEFVLVVLPISLLVLPLLDLFGLLQEVIVKEQIALDISRYASLADVTSDQADDYRLAVYPESTLSKVDSGSVCINQTAIDVTREIIFWPYPVEFSAMASVYCETP